MDELRERLQTARLSNWEHWPTVRGLWPWFAALGLVILIAIPWGIRAEERNLESESRAALNEAGIAFEDISFTGRQATIVADLSTNEQIAAVNVLAEVGGISRVGWEEGDVGAVAQPPTTTVAPTTTTATPEPGADLTASVNDGKITLRGIVPNAQTIKDVSDAAGDVWGLKVVNQLFVDGSVLAHPWLGSADESIAVLSTLIDPQLSLDHQGATLTGGAISQEVLDSAMQRLSTALGPDVAINNKVTVTPLDLPNILIISPGDGTADITGKVASPSLRRSIGVAVAATAEELEITSSVTTTDTTADVYLMQRIPEVISVLGSAEQWTLQFDGRALAGVVVGGKTFTGNRVKATAQLADLLVQFSSFLQADPNLVIELEVHADPRDEGADETVLAQERADAIAAQLVRLGIDPSRISSTTGPGEGELLRFMLIPAEK